MMARLRKHSLYSKSTDSGNDSLDEDLACRLLFLGAGSVGKTSIIQRFLPGVSKTRGDRRTQRTLHEMYSGSLSFASGDVTSSVSLSIEDTGGNYCQNFPAMFEISIREADVVVLVYSVQEAASAEYISGLRETILSKRPDMPILIVANKTEDVLEGTGLSLKEMEAIACLDWEVGYAECSAKLDHNIHEVFREAVIQAGIVPRIVSLLDRGPTKSSLLKRITFRPKTRNFSIY